MKTTLLTAIAALGLAIAAPIFSVNGERPAILADGGDYVVTNRQTADGGDYVVTNRQTADGGDYVVTNLQTADGGDYVVTNQQTA
jgi:Fe-S cluster biogenesis protein NfuA